MALSYSNTATVACGSRCPGLARHLHTGTYLRWLLPACIPSRGPKNDSCYPFFLGPKHSSLGAAARLHSEGVPRHCPGSVPELGCKQAAAPGSPQGQLNVTASCAMLQ